MWRVHANAHVTPIDDLREHEPKMDCWCGVTEHEQFDGVWIHHSIDCRELFETGERKPS